MLFIGIPIVEIGNHLNGQDLGTGQINESIPRMEYHVAMSQKNLFRNQRLGLGPSLNNGGATQVLSPLSLGFRICEVGVTEPALTTL